MRISDWSSDVCSSDLFNIVGDVVADMTRAKIKNAGLDRNVPRIPALRVLGGLEAQGERVDARVEVEWTDDQTRVAQFETPTDGFTLVNASLSWRPLPDTKNLTMMLSDRKSTRLNSSH